MKPKRFQLHFWLSLIVILHGVAYVGGAAVGYFVDQLDRSTWPSWEQKLRIASFGYPDRWLLADDEHRRYEQWIYPKRGEILEFLDGIPIGKTQHHSVHKLPPNSLVHPDLFDRWMNLDTVETILSEKAISLDAFNEQGYRAFFFKRARLLVLTKDERFRGGLVL